VLLDATTVGTLPTIWDPQYQAPTYHIKPRPTISGPDIQYQAPKLSSDSGHVQSVFLPVQRAKFMNISINKMELNYFFPQLCIIPFTICQVSSKIVKQRQSTWPLRRSYSWSRWIMSNSRRSTVLCFTASKNKRKLFNNNNIYYLYSAFPCNVEKRITIVYNLITKQSPLI